MRKFVLCWLALAASLALFSGGCAGRPTSPEGPVREIIIASHHSTRAEESSGAPFLACLEQHFKLPEGVTQARYGGVALYLSRFYGYTDLFAKARRCDSFVLNYATDGTVEGYPWYHVAMFSFDDQRSVDLIRKLENRDTDSLRTRATDEAPGQLNFKSGIECYRVYFSERKVIFFFFQGWPRLRGMDQEDPELYAAALRLKECLLRPEE